MFQFIIGAAAGYFYSKHSKEINEWVSQTTQGMKASFEQSNADSFKQSVQEAAQEILDKIQAKKKAAEDAEFKQPEAEDAEFKQPEAEEATELSDKELLKASYEAALADYLCALPEELDFPVLNGLTIGESDLVKDWTQQYAKKIHEVTGPHEVVILCASAMFFADKNNLEYSQGIPISRTALARKGLDSVDFERVKALLEAVTLAETEQGVLEALKEHMDMYPKA